MTVSMTLSLSATQVTITSSYYCWMHFGPMDRDAVGALLRLVNAPKFVNGYTGTTVYQLLARGKGEGSVRREGGIVQESTCPIHTLC